MKIYTRTGDNGTTGLFGGKRIRKNSNRMHAIGTVDELNAWIGLLRTHTLPRKLVECIRVKQELEHIQHDLFVIGAMLATPFAKTKSSSLRLSTDRVCDLEKCIDTLDATLPKLKHFILPGGHEFTAHIHIARAVCRRAERIIVSYAQKEKLDPVIQIFLNRLSDFLFILSRAVNHATQHTEIFWQKK